MSASDDHPLLPAIVSFGRYIKALGFSPCEDGLLRSGEQGFKKVRQGDSLQDQPLFISFALPPIIDTVNQCKHLQHKLTNLLEETVKGMERRWRNQSGDKEATFDVRLKEGRVYIDVHPIMGRPELAEKFFDTEIKRDSRRIFFRVAKILMGGALTLGGASITIDGVRRAFNSDNTLLHRSAGAFEVVPGLTMAATGIEEAGVAGAEIARDANPLLHALNNEDQWRNFVLALQEQVSGKSGHINRT